MKRIIAPLLAMLLAVCSCASALATASGDTLAQQPGQLSSINTNRGPEIPRVLNTPGTAISDVTKQSPAVANYYDYAAQWFQSHGTSDDFPYSDFREYMENVLDLEYQYYLADEYGEVASAGVENFEDWLAYFMSKGFVPGWGSWWI